jgi:hypothetical protein
LCPAKLGLFKTFCYVAAAAAADDDDDDDDGASE